MLNNVKIGYNFIKNIKLLMLWYFDSLMGVRIVKNRFIRKISLIFIIMLFLIGMSYTIVNAAATEEQYPKWMVWNGLFLLEH